MSHKKGIYIDGHEREDVVKYREEYLKILDKLQHSHQPRPLCSDERPPTPPPTPSSMPPSESNDKILVMLYHDESIFNTNEAQTWMWTNLPFSPKQKAQG